MEFDALMIGFGKGAKTLAGYLGKQGKKVAVIEKSDKMYGGTCINVGCIPSKSLYMSARESALSSDTSFAGKQLRYAAAIDEKIRVTAMLRKKNYEKLVSNQNISVIHGAASFTGSHELSVVTAEKTLSLSAPQIFINTGSVPVVPKIDGIANNSHVFFSETLMDLHNLPQSLAIIGGGYIGLEFASMYANFGSKVTVFQDSQVFLPREDNDIASAIKELLEKQGISFVTGADIQKVGSDGTVFYAADGKEQSFASDAVLVATGRRPATDNLGLDKAGIEMTARGAVATDDFLRTNVPGVWAMGDVTGRLQFTYTSLDDYRIVYLQLVSGVPSYSLAQRKNVPYNVFLDTPFGRAGMNEKEAEKAGISYRAVTMPAAAIPKAQVLRRTGGMLKALIDTKTNRILGAMLLCEESWEVINIVKLAMDMEVPYTVLRDQIFTHPTMSESLNDLFSL